MDPAGQSLEYPLDVSATLNADPTAIRPATRAMIERLIAFDTTSRNSNLELIHYVRDYLADLGVAAELVHDADGRKANLYATLGPAGRPGSALYGHTARVQTEHQDRPPGPWQDVHASARPPGAEPRHT